MTTPSRHAIWPWLGVLALGALALWLRYGVIEVAATGQFCASAHAPWWCAVRHVLVLGFLHNVYGIAGLIAALWALWSRRIRVATLAAALGLFALVLYGFQSGALALLVGSLRLLHLQTRGQEPGR